MSKERAEGGFLWQRGQFPACKPCCQKLAEPQTAGGGFHIALHAGDLPGQKDARRGADWQICLANAGSAPAH